MSYHVAKKRAGRRPQVIAPLGDVGGDVLTFDEGVTAALDALLKLQALADVQRITATSGSASDIAASVAQFAATDGPASVEQASATRDFSLLEDVQNQVRTVMPRIQGALENDIIDRFALATLLGPLGPVVSSLPGGVLDTLKIGAAALPWWGWGLLGLGGAVGVSFVVRKLT